MRDLHPEQGWGHAIPPEEGSRQLTRKRPGYACHDGLRGRIRAMGVGRSALSEDLNSYHRRTEKEGKKEGTKGFPRLLRLSF